MRIPHQDRALQAISLGLLLFTVGACAPKNPVKPPEPPPPIATPPPARPTVTLQASPTFIQQGESTTLTWSSTNATTLTLSPGGTVAPEGSTKLSPTESTTYSITASGPGGAAESSARVTVSASAPAQPQQQQPTATIEEMFRSSVVDAYFDYNKADIRADARDALARTAEFLRGYPQIKVNIEGHCDERGSTEYNLGLGETRAQAVRQFLISLGVAPERMSTVSLGKERPFCTESSEACWQQNRRGHIVLAR